MVVVRISENHLEIADRSSFLISAASRSVHLYYRGNLMTVTKTPDHETAVSFAKLLRDRIESGEINLLEIPTKFSNEKRELTPEELESSPF